MIRLFITIHPWLLFFLYGWTTGPAWCDVVNVTDSLGRQIQIQTPVKRIIALGNYRLEAVKVLGAAGRVVGMDSDSRKNSAYYFPELTTLPDVGTWKAPNYEAIAGLGPDLVIMSANTQRLLPLEEKLRPFGVVVVGLDFFRDDTLASEIQTLGKILGKEDQARHYLHWRNTHQKKIADYVSSLDKNMKPEIYMEWGVDVGRSWGKGDSGDVMCAYTGGINIVAQMPGALHVTMEWVAEQDPDVIVKCLRLTGNHWGWPNGNKPQDLIASLSKRPGLSLTKAVQNKRVYVYCAEIAWGLDSIVAAAYWLRWFHPGADIDPEAIYREYVKDFLKIDYPEGRVFAYPHKGCE